MWLKVNDKAGGASSWTLGGSSGSSSPMSNSTGGDARAPGDVLKKQSSECWPDNDVFFSFRISSQTPCPVAAARCPLHLMSSNNLMAASVSPSPSVNFKTVTVLRWGSGSLTSSRALCFHIWTNHLWDPNESSSANWRYFWHHTYEFVCLA